MMRSDAGDGSSLVYTERFVYLGLRWFALQVRPRCENAAASILRDKGYEVFLPVGRSRRVWSDRITELMLPLFPGYVFCCFDLFDRSVPIVSSPGVIRIVGVGKKPVPLDHMEIAALQKAVSSGLEIEPWPYLQVGNTVRIEYGSLSGIEGTLVAVKKGHRLILSVTLLQRSVSVEVDRAWIARWTPPGVKGTYGQTPNHHF